MTDKVISLAEKTGDGCMHTAKQALEEALADLAEGEFLENHDKILVLALNDSDGYDVRFIQAGMKMSQCLTLCEVAKTIFLSEMDYINRGGL